MRRWHCDGHWCTAPSVAVLSCSVGDPCCGVDCGAHGKLETEQCGCGCFDGFSGRFCQLAPAWLVSGVSDSWSDASYNGRYERLSMQCNDKPVYQRIHGMRGSCVNTFSGAATRCGPVLYQPTASQVWVLAPHTYAAQCTNDAEIGNMGSCYFSPDGDGCVAKWRARRTGQSTLSSHSWQAVSPSITVAACPPENPCCGIRCGSHGILRGDGTGSTPCGCVCTDNYSGEFCERAPSYVVTGASNSSYNGLYELVDTDCVTTSNVAPVYLLSGSDSIVLTKPGSGQAVGEWIVISNFESCNASYLNFRSTQPVKYWIKSRGQSSNCRWTGCDQQSCVMVPDGTDCDRQWQEFVEFDEYDETERRWVPAASRWQLAPAIAVSACPTDNLCCGVSCGVHGTLDIPRQVCRCSCSGGYVGAFCQLAPGYAITGAVDTQLNGRYERTGRQCSGQPVYQLDGIAGHALYLAKPYPWVQRWVVGPSDHATSCSAEIRDANIYGPLSSGSTSYGRSTGCPLSPAGSGCAGLWYEMIPALGDSRSAATLAVSECPLNGPC